jgi:hypothetical protein
MGLGWSYVALAGTRGGARHWALRASTAIAASACGLLHLAGEAVPARRREVAERASARFGLDSAAFIGLLGMREAGRTRVEARLLLDAARQILSGLLEAAEAHSAAPQS